MDKVNFVLVLILIIFLIFISGCRGNIVEIDNGEEVIKVNVEIADAAGERGKGLMFREGLGGDEGMLFIFEDSRERNFWMKNTLIPLDIVFISEDFEILNIEEAEPCENELCEIYSSDGSAKYVLEVNQGYSKKNNIKAGDNIKIK